jgi:hypothetical protein
VSRRGDLRHPRSRSVRDPSSAASGDRSLKRRVSASPTCAEFSSERGVPDPLSSYRSRRPVTSARPCARRSHHGRDFPVPNQFPRRFSLGVVRRGRSGSLDRADRNERIIDSRRPFDHRRADPNNNARRPNSRAAGTSVRLGSASRRNDSIGPCDFAVPPDFPAAAVGTGVVLRICGPGPFA